MTALLVFAVDPSLGRVDKNSVSQQTLMELLISTFNERKKHICGFDEDPWNFYRWVGVRVNDANDVVEIDWYYLSLEGSLELKWLPPKSRNVSFTWNKLTGTVDLTVLPEPLEIFSLSTNRFHGTIDLTQLPSGLTDIFLECNDFSGKTDFSKLPQSLTTLSVQTTMLEGEIIGFQGLNTLNSKVKVL